MAAKKAPAKKVPAKKAPARKVAAQKAPARMTAAKKPPMPKPAPKKVSAGSKRVAENNANAKARRDKKGNSGFGKTGSVPTKKASAGSQRIADEKKSQKLRRDVKGSSGFGRSGVGANRKSSKSGLTGFGMTKTGVEDRAKSASYRRIGDYYSQAMVDYDPYSRLTSWMAYGGKGPSKNGKKVSEKTIDKDALSASNNVRRKYGVKQIKSMDEQRFRNNYGSKGRDSFPYSYDLSRGGKFETGRIGRH